MKAFPAWSFSCCIAATFVLFGCSSPHLPRGDFAASKDAITILDISALLHEEWRHLRIKGHTDFRILLMESALAIAATGAGGASGLIRQTNIDTIACPYMNWIWRVDQLQATADLANKATDDVAAAIFLLFGDPGFLSNPDPVPTLRYVWTTDRHKVGDIVANPYMPAVVRNVVIEAGRARMGQWVSERRNVYADFEKAFGYPPKEAVAAVAIFTDNDQTKEPVAAYYRTIDCECLAAAQ